MITSYMLPLNVTTLHGARVLKKKIEIGKNHGKAAKASTHS